MNREPLSLYLIRIFGMIGIFVFLLLLYWSSNLIEKDLIGIRSEITQIKNDISLLHEEIKSVENPIENGDDQTKQTLPSMRLHTDDSFPNLLEADPFYETTLPKLLGKNFAPQGIRRAATIGKPSNLHPFSNWAQVVQWQESCTDSVANQKFGIWETLSPALAIKMEARPRKDMDIDEFWVHLRKDVFWQPLTTSLFQGSIALAPWFQKKHLVTAHDFKFYLDAVMNLHLQESGAVAIRNYLRDIEQVEVLDDFTFVVRWKPISVEENGKITLKLPYIAKLSTGGLHPLPRFVYQYFADGSKIIENDEAEDTYRTNSVWAQNFTQHWAKNGIISCGPWIFEGMSDAQVSLLRNPHFYNPLAALVKKQEITIRENPDSVWQDFKVGTLDTFNLQPEQFIEWKDFQNSSAYHRQQSDGLAIKRLDYLARSFTYIGWNQATPYFQNKKVRQAMTMAIDRKRIIDDILNGMGVEITGPFAINSPSYDRSIQPYPYDPERAKQLLEEEGWFDTNGDGIRDKIINGKSVPFRFSLTYYVKNPTSDSICNYVATALKQIGVICDLNGVDISDLAQMFDAKSFDAISLIWVHGAPPEDPRQLWHSSGAQEKGSSNAIGFANEEVDEIIETLRYESNPQTRKKLYYRFHEIIHEEAPYTFLYTPKTALLYREYLQNVFIPAERQDLIPGANVDQPEPQIWWIRK